MTEALTNRSRLEQGISGQKELIIAGDRGPCGGVNMALDITSQVLDLVEGREKVFANHNPVHNDPILREFKERGLVIEPNLANIPEGGIIIFSAHGTPPSYVEEAANRGLNVVNVECTYVTKVRRRAMETILKNGHVLYVGAKNHPEPDAVLKDLPEGGYTFLDVKEHEQITLPQGKQIKVLNQTTLSTTEIDRRKDEIAEETGEPLPDPIGICYATDDRQKAVREGLFGEEAARPDRLIVVGSKSSHNTEELVNIGIENLGEELTYWIDGIEELNPDWFLGASRVGLTSGASVLDRFTEPVIEWFRQMGYKIKILPPTRDEFTFKGPDLSKLQALLNQKYSSN